MQVHKSLLFLGCLKLSFDNLLDMNISSSVCKIRVDVCSQFSFFSSSSCFFLFCLFFCTQFNTRLFSFFLAFKTRTRIFKSLILGKETLYFGVCRRRDWVLYWLSSRGKEKKKKKLFYSIFSSNMLNSS